MKKKNFAILFCLTMLLTFLPATVYATNDDAASETVMIDTVTITGLSGPVAGKPQDLSITIAEQAFVDRTGMMWCDITRDHRFLDASVLFQAGHEYFADIFVELKQGYAFSSDAKVCVDGQWITPYNNYTVGVQFRVQFGLCEDPSHVHTPSDWRTTETSHYKVCTDCDKTLEQEGHKGGNATCSEKGKCTVCGYAYIEKNENHTPDTKWTASDKQDHAQLCKLCGARCNSEAHKPGPAATATNPQKCTVCDYIINPATHTHTLTSVAEVAPTCIDQGVKAHYACSSCSMKFSDAAGKNVIAADKDLSIAPLEHKISDSWEFDETAHWHTCSVCKSKVTETDMEHDLQEGKCTACDYDSATPKEEATPETKEETTSAPAEPQTQPQETEKDGLPWWGLLLIGLGAVGAGIGGVLILKKRQ